MEFIKPYDQFINEEFKKVDSKHFYLVVNLTDKVKEALINREFNGITGISDNIGIVNHWLDVRNILIIMDSEETLELNPNMYKIDYDNTHQLVASNFYLINRILQNKDVYYSNIFSKIYDNYKRSKYASDYKFSKKYESVNRVAEYWRRHNWEFHELAEKKSPNVNNLNDFVNWVMKMLPEIKVETKNNIPHGTEPMNINDIKKEDLYFIFDTGLRNIAETFKTEGEWIIKPDKITGSKKLKLPKNTKIIFKLIPESPEERMKYKYNLHGLYGHKLDEVKEFIKNSHLDKLYDIEFMEGHLKIYDILNNI